MIPLAGVVIAALVALGGSADDLYNQSLHAVSPKERMELLNRALENSPNYVPALRQRAFLHQSLGHKGEMLADLVRAAQLSPQDVELNVVAAGAAMEAKAFTSAVPLLEQAITVEPASPQARAALIESLIRLRRASDALPHANDLVRRYPDKDFAYYARANVYDWLGRYRDAAADISVLIGRNPDEGKYYPARCQFLREAGDYAAALADAKKALDLLGENEKAYAAIGCCHEGLAQWPEALEAYAKASSLAEDKRYYAIWTCLVLQKQGKRDEAVKAAKDAVTNLKSPDEWIVPVIRFLAGDATENDVLRLAKNDDPEKNRGQMCEAYYYLGAAAMAAGNLDKAEQLMKKAVEQQENEFYENGFALRDLKVIEGLRAKKAGQGGGGK